MSPSSRTEHGFTLVELMVVVLIIGILVAIAIPVFNSASSSARQRSCHSNQRAIESAVMQYASNAAATGGTIGDCAGSVTATPLVGDTGYIKRPPRCNPGRLTYTLDAFGNTICPNSGTDDHGTYDQ